MVDFYGIHVGKYRPYMDSMGTDGICQEVESSSLLLMLRFRNSQAQQLMVGRNFSNLLLGKIGCHMYIHTYVISQIYLYIHMLYKDICIYHISMYLSVYTLKLT